MEQVMDRRNRPAIGVACLVAGILGLIAAPQIVQAGLRAVPNGTPGLGRMETCVLDTRSTCTLQHGLGTKPSAVIVQEGLGGQNATVDPATVTNTSYRVRWLWHDGKTFPAGTTMRFYVHFDFAPVVTTPPSTPSTTPSPPSTSPTSPSPSPVKSCTNPSFVTTSTNNIGDGRSYGPYFIHNNMWNNSNGTYTLSVCNYDNWFEDVTQPLPGDRGVQAYPNVHKDYDDVPLSKIQSARFAATTPESCSGCIYNVAFDAWIGDGLNNELMIWTENKGQAPAGNKVATVTFGGFTYDVWHESGYTAYVSQVTQKSGTMPLASFFDDMVKHGWVPKATTWQVDYGVEIVSTANVKQRFAFTDFAITEN
jgi:hypothetical protein